MQRPVLSVVVPVHQGEASLDAVLAGLAASGLARGRWELIVVDDASTDGSAAVAAKWADRVISIPDRARGPSFARNRGAEAAAGDWVVFVDADVVVRHDTLSRCAQWAERDDADLVGVAGSYDEAPTAPGFVSQYRNLLHRYTHLRGRGEAETFWAGCGAVRRDTFLEVGGFDEEQYPRPQIEDIELGYRLRDRGGRLVMDPEIQGTHLKHWTFTGGLRTDVWDRGVPWVRLLLARRRLGNASTLNLARGERLKTFAVWLALVLAVFGGVARQPVAVMIGAVLVGGVLLSNASLLGWFARQRGVGFAALVAPMNLWYYLVSGACVVVGLGVHLAFVNDGAMNTDQEAGDAFGRAFLPMHKRAFGVATGVAAAVIVFLATVVTIVRHPQGDFGIHLLNQYFAGYSVSWPGAFIGAAWAAFTGFVMGWFLAFTRNLSIGVLVTVIRARAQLAQTRDFLDHI
jgi:glycosyltransferase involved in cell wall biosynthesis